MLCGVIFIWEELYLGLYDSGGAVVSSNAIVHMFHGNMYRSFGAGAHGFN